MGFCDTLGILYSIDIQHMEMCLRFYGFPDEYVKAFMLLSCNGTCQFEVNGFLSEKHKLERGTGQGDPKSAFAYNLCVSPMNEVLSKSPEVPRFKVGDEDINPVYFADDNATMFKGDDDGAFINVLIKIAIFNNTVTFMFRHLLWQMIVRLISRPDY